MILDRFASSMSHKEIAAWVASFLWYATAHQSELLRQAFHATRSSSSRSWLRLLKEAQGRIPLRTAAIDFAPEDWPVQLCQGETIGMRCYWIPGKPITAAVRSTYQHVERVALFLIVTRAISHHFWAHPQLSQTTDDITTMRREWLFDVPSLLDATAQESEQTRKLTQRQYGSKAQWQRAVISTAMFFGRTHPLRFVPDHDDTDTFWVIGQDQKQYHRLFSVRITEPARTGTLIRMIAVPLEIATHYLLPWQPSSTIDLGHSDRTA